MERKQRKIIYLIATVLAILCFLATLIYSSPATPITFGFIALPSPIIFFLTLMIAIYFVSGLIMKNVLHGVLISTFTGIFFLLRVNNLRSPIFLILLLALFVVIEMMITSKKTAQ